MLNKVKKEKALKAAN